MPRGSRRSGAHARCRAASGVHGSAMPTASTRIRVRYSPSRGLQRERRAVGAVVAPGPLPATVVADGDPGPVGEAGEAGLHLRPRREVRRAVHEPGLQRPELGLERDQAVPVVALVLACRQLLGRVGLGPRQEPLEERPAPEHAAGRRVRGQDRVLDAVVLEPVRHLQPAGAAADDDGRVLPGREGTRVGGHGQLRQRLALRSRRACAWSIRYMTWGWSTRKPWTSLPAIWMQSAARWWRRRRRSAARPAGSRPRRRSRPARGSRAAARRCGRPRCRRGSRRSPTRSAPGGGSARPTGTRPRRRCWRPRAAAASGGRRTA